MPVGTLMISAIVTPLVGGKKHAFLLLINYSLLIRAAPPVMLIP